MKDCREELANLCHEQWIGWMKYLFGTCMEEFTNYMLFETTGRIIIPRWAAERWRRQINTDYTNLSEEEKESDRKEADKFINLFEKQLQEKEMIRELFQKLIKHCEKHHGVMLNISTKHLEIDINKLLSEYKIEEI